MRAIADGRWSCHGCGFCCRFHQLGPVEPATVRAIDATEPATWWPAAAGGWCRTTMSPQGPVYELAKVDGHCVFLGDDLRCGVHARLGAAAKPGFCRLFPYQFVEDADGLAVVVRSSCGGLHSSRHDGRPVVDAEDALALAREGGVVLRWTPERVTLLPGWTVDLHTWMGWERRLIAWLEQAEGGPARLVAGVRERLAEWGETTLPAADPARARLATRAVVMALDMTLTQVQQAETPPSQAEADFVAELLRRLKGAALSLESGDDPVLDGDARDYVRQLLASALLGKDVQRLDGVFAGLGRFLVGVEIAARAARGPGTAALAAEHTRIVRFTLNRSVRHVLSRARPALDDLAVYVPA